ncbi:hypothetical protein Q3A80_29170 [Burkholderia sp. SR8]|uniref:hypothetical protein n=1 Tax=Burkholderia sp. SR8 TaxID=3062277 RepID=UPI00406414FB
MTLSTPTNASIARHFVPEEFRKPEQRLAPAGDRRRAFGGEDARPMYAGSL